MLLRDYLIHIDNVVGMEHLSIESYVSNVISKGIYMGMTQNSSSFTAHFILNSVLVHVESELVHATSAGAQTAMLAGTGSAANLTGPDMAVVLATKRSTLVMPSFRSSPAYAPSAGSSQAEATFLGSRTINSNLYTRRLFDNSFGGNAFIDIPPHVVEHIRKLLRLGGMEQGMESEMRKIVGNYIFQYQLYARELSEDRLTRRMSSLSSEKTILQYCLLFERDTLASALDSLNYTAADSPGYKSFADLLQYQKTLAGSLKHIRSRRKKLIAQLEASKEKKGESVSATPRSNLTPEKHDETPAAAAATEGEAVTKPEVKSYSSVTESLGLKFDIDGLNDDLSTDYSLDIYNYHYHYNVIEKTGDKVRLYGQQSDYPGFSLVTSDVYSRVKNPFMVVNEIAAIRFNELLNK